MKISMIVAMSTNRVIGIENQLPWKLSGDMAWFKKQTMNKIMLLGRKTWESLPIRPLPGREHIIISKNKSYIPLSVSGQEVSSVNTVNSVDAALETAHDIAAQFLENRDKFSEAAELMVIGGATIYQLMLPLCDKLYITRVKGDFSGDAWFPELDESQWQEVFSESHSADEKNQYDYDFIVLHRKL
jgi:dihydrofolate reductase